jgi:copper chaperone CopZ
MRLELLTRPLLAMVIAAPLAAELLETEITFEGTGCVSCAESLEPRLTRIRGVESVELNLERSRIRLKLEPGNKARIGPLRLRVTQDGTKILAMTAIVQGVALEKDGAWFLAVGGGSETLLLHPARGLALEAGQAYRMSGKLTHPDDGELTLAADAAQPIPQP